MAASAPDLIRPIVAFRQWRLRDDGLWSLRADEHWGRGVLTARCRAAVPHAGPAPQNGCTCGFYAWYVPRPRTSVALTADLVNGAVAMWGAVELHAHGLRAERAMVVALALPLLPGPKRDRVRAAARALEAEAVPARRLRKAALAHGEPVPKTMRPPDLEPNKRKAPGEPAPARLYAVADGLRQRGPGSHARRG
ncbi:MAG TPA: hypothetical protein VN751_02295 [Solirubrobacteraceae bacterium]|jgi:hypothetical protein|nr:hypothetical protein [Solirubrobacteraceae bacterium]